MHQPPGDAADEQGATCRAVPLLQRLQRLHEARLLLLVERPRELGVRLQRATGASEGLMMRRRQQPARAGVAVQAAATHEVVEATLRRGKPGDEPHNRQRPLDLLGYPLDVVKHPAQRWRVGTPSCASSGPRRSGGWHTTYPKSCCCDAETASGALPLLERSQGPWTAGLAAGAPWAPKARGALQLRICDACAQ